jgi:CRISPR system Cascade subunit CasD
MSAVLLIPLAGPMQSWGTRSRFQDRDTEREPSKSGVIGLLCAALGRDRSQPVDDLVALIMGVRVDREGLLKNDFQTVQNVVVATGEEWEDQISNRHYLSDAVFLVGFEGNIELLRRLHAALANPVWPLFLGRKSYVPSLPLYLKEGLREGSDLRTALLEFPLLYHPKNEEKIRFVLESQTVTYESRMDSPVSFTLDRREFQERFVRTEYITIDTFPQKEGVDVPFTAFT